jgi:hypothetical protein
MILHELSRVEEGVVGISWFFLVSFIMVDRRETMGEGGNSVFFWVFGGRWLHLRLFECLVFFFLLRENRENTCKYLFFIIFWFF